MKIFLLFLTVLASSLFNTIMAQNEKEQKKLAQLKEVHSSWTDCFIIGNKGDTTWGKIKYADDGGQFGRRLYEQGRLIFAYPDEHEEKLDASQLTELNVKYHNITGKYITLLADTSARRSKFFSVLIDGPCNLLFEEITRSGGGGMTANGAMMGGGYGPTLVDKYYLYYKGTLTKVITDDFFTMSPKFKKKCAEILHECPGLMQKIEDKTYEVSDIREIVKSFNECVGNSAK
jgi:hypothetical protein